MMTIHKRRLVDGSIPPIDLSQQNILGTRPPATSENRAKIILTSCGGCLHRSEVFWNGEEHYSFCLAKGGEKVVAHGPPWTVPDDCPHLMKPKKGKKK